MILGYTIGTSLGVYIVAKSKTPNISFWGTQISGFIGSGIGVGIFQASNQRGVGSLAPLILPIVASIIYVELIE